MTNLNEVNFGFNQFCGPAVMSILTGKSTDECAAVISRVSGRREIRAVAVNELLSAFSLLGFKTQYVPLVAGTLFGLLTALSPRNGMYIVFTEKHVVAVEITNKQIFFCDNHSKQPIPAEVSARLMNKVTGCYLVTAPPPPTPEQIRAAKLASLRAQLTAVDNKISHLELELARYRMDRDELVLRLRKIESEVENVDANAINKVTNQTDANA